MPAAAPVNARLETVTVFPLPTLGVLKLAVPVHATASPPTTPLSVQIASVALVVPSYGLSDAVTAGVTVTAVMLAAVVAVVVEDV